MTEKKLAKIDKLISAISKDDQKPFREVAEYVVTLGYNPKLNGKETYADFIKSKHGKTIMKIDIDPRFPPRLAIRCDALPAWSGIFYKALEKRVDLLEGMGHTVRCWGCGKCDGTIGYAYSLTDGREGFLCGRGVIDLPTFSSENVAEVKEALKVQDDFLMSNIP